MRITSVLLPAVMASSASDYDIFIKQPRRLATLGGLSFRRQKPPPTTSRDAFLALLKRKGVWLEDVDNHPLVLGIPLGRSGGQEKAIAVDVGLKNMASISLRALARASPNVHRRLPVSYTHLPLPTKA